MRQIPALQGDLNRTVAKMEHANLLPKEIWLAIIGLLVLFALKRLGIA